MMPSSGADSTRASEYSVTAADCLYRQADKIMAEGGFIFAKCHSNDEQMTELFFT